jgi:hypothetical protein
MNLQEKAARYIELANQVKSIDKEMKVLKEELIGGQVEFSTDNQRLMYVAGYDKYSVEPALVFGNIPDEDFVSLVGITVEKWDRYARDNGVQINPKKKVGVLLPQSNYYPYRRIL